MARPVGSLKQLLNDPIRFFLVFSKKFYTVAKICPFIAILLQCPRRHIDGKPRQCGLHRSRHLSHAPHSCPCTLGGYGGLLEFLLDPIQLNTKSLVLLFYLLNGILKPLHLSKGLI